MTAEPASCTPLSEQTIVGRAQDGDIASFEILARHYQGPIFRLAYRMLSDRGDAEDVVQDTLVQVWRRLPTLTDPDRFRGWIYQIATRRCLSMLRQATRRQTQPATADDLQSAHDDNQDRSPGRNEGSHQDPASTAVHAAQIRGLQTQLHTLTAEQRACWVLRELHELTYPEIAQALLLPVSTVRGCLARARQNLARGMATWR